MTPEQRAYYSRQLRLPGFGLEAQERLQRASVLIVGVGGLGCPAALYLAAAGVGRLTLVDFDRVHITNLHRQILFTTEDIGRLKCEVARRRLRSLNPHIEIEALSERLDRENAVRMARAHDIILDASDNFDTRYLLNEVCLQSNRPLVSAAILGFRGQLAVFNHKGGPCYRCLFPEQPVDLPNCAESGVIGALPGILGAQQAMETLKVLLDHESALSESFLTYDALTTSLTRFQMSRDPACPSCGADRKPFSCQRPVVDAATLRTWRAQQKPLYLLDVRSGDEYLDGTIEGSRHLALTELFTGEGLPRKNELIVVFCQSGHRSFHAAGRLRENGFSNVVELAGGYDAWQALVPEQIITSRSLPGREEPREPAFTGGRRALLSGFGDDTGPDL